MPKKPNPKPARLADLPAGKRMPGRPRRATNASPESTRDSLLDAAIDLFARYGYDPVTTGAVAKAAGLTQSMVHYHFGSKSKLWEAAIDRLMRRRGQMFRATARDLIGLDPVEKLKLLTRRLIEANASNPDYVRIAIHEGMTRSPRLKWLARNYITSGFQVFDETVREAIEAGAIRDMPVHDVTNAVTSAASLTLSLGSLIEELYGIDMAEPDRVSSFSDSVIRILFDGLLARPETPKRPPEGKPRPAGRPRASRADLAG
ncbi:TetR/AcrR family transcriptional regulator [Phreatobacter stygius]|uniref:TetR/AcrR family transcriptional regulator n=1 Tax=Phreatobacter stygius TaxID=1940610 RepID=A0A4D7BF88_9HYPH|nr:TetR/AcrR family transcriptional regulator [Phreatobacter stygius]QCI66602.1 TetR/AcrR family transcriptional regulator [Phreatobacter stygius]